MPEFMYKNKLYYNPVEFAMDLIGGTWKIPILWRLQSRTMRYSELKKDIPHITDKMLTSQLKLLQEEGFIHREVYAMVPPKTEYSLTEKGKTCIPVMTTIRDYGLYLMKDVGIEDQKNTKSGD